MKGKYSTFSPNLIRKSCVINKGGTMNKILFRIIPALLLFFFLLSIPCSAKSITVLVLPFENTGDKEYSWISAGMTDTIITEFTNIENIRVVSNRDRKKALHELKFAQTGFVEEDQMIKIGKFTGAQVIFTGSYLVSGNHIRVNARLVNVETAKVENSTKIDGTIDGIFDIQDKVVLTLMGDAEKISIAGVKPVKLSEKDRKKIAIKPKPKLTAYEWYAKGLDIKDTNPKEALANFRKALDIDPDYNDALIEAGFTAGSTFDLFSEALGYLERAEKNVQGNRKTKSVAYAKLMVSMGSVYWGKGQHDSALECFQKAQTTLEGLGLQNGPGYAMLMNNTGVVYQHKDQPDRALEFYLKSESIYDAQGQQNSNGYAMLMTNIGIVYSGKGQHSRELEYFLKAQSTYDGLGLQNTAGYGNLMNNIGAVCMDLGQDERALEYYLKSQFTYDGLGMQKTVAYGNLIKNIAFYYEKQGSRDRAGKFYRMAYDIYMKAGYSGQSKDRALNSAKRLGY